MHYRCFVMRLMQFSITGICMQACKLASYRQQKNAIHKAKHHIRSKQNMVQGKKTCAKSKWKTPFKARLNVLKLSSVSFDLGSYVQKTGRGSDIPLLLTWIIQGHLNLSNLFKYLASNNYFKPDSEDKRILFYFDISPEKCETRTVSPDYSYKTFLFFWNTSGSSNFSDCKSMVSSSKWQHFNKK